MFEKYSLPRVLSVPIVAAHVVLHNRLQLLIRLTRAHTLHAMRVRTRESVCVCVFRELKNRFQRSSARSGVHSPISISIHEIISTASSTLTFKAACVAAQNKTCRNSLKRKKAALTTIIYVRHSPLKITHVYPSIVCVQN